MSSTLIWAAVGLLVFGVILGFLIGFFFSIFLIAKDRSLVRIKEGEVVISQKELESLIKSASSNKKRQYLEED